MEIKTTTSSKFYKKKKKNPIFVSSIIFILVFIITIGIYFFNSNLLAKIGKIQSDIDLKNKSIRTLKKDKLIVAYKIYKNNEKELNKLERYSQISKYIKHLYSLRRIYHIRFKGFKYNSGILKTTVISSSPSNINSSSQINYKKTYNFITKYRDSAISLFHLNPINSIITKNEGVDNVFAIELKLKDNIKESLKNKN